MKSKEDKMLELFFNQPTKEWHFKDILKQANIARSKADRWLKSFMKENLIKRIKVKGKMPHYIGNYKAPAYQNRKKLYAQQKLYETGFLNHLSSLKQAKAVIIFGSFANWDWHEKSDIDLFIYGSPEGLSIAEYEMKLHREIQLFICRNKEELSKIQPLLKSIMRGNLIKGEFQCLNT